MCALFGPAAPGVATLSDIQTLSPIDALAGTYAADNLLILRLGSRRLLEVNRLSQVLSFLNLSSVLPHNGIEGVTIDENGTIFWWRNKSRIGATCRSIRIRDRN